MRNLRFKKNIVLIDSQKKINSLNQMILEFELLVSALENRKKRSGLLCSKIDQISILLSTVSNQGLNLQRNKQGFCILHLEKALYSGLVIQAGGVKKLFRPVEIIENLLFSQINMQRQHIIWHTQALLDFSNKAVFVPKFTRNKKSKQFSRFYRNEKPKNHVKMCFNASI